MNDRRSIALRAASVLLESPMAGVLPPNFAREISLFLHPSTQRDERPSFNGAQRAPLPETPWSASAAELREGYVGLAFLRLLLVSAFAQIDTNDRDFINAGEFRCDLRPMLPQCCDQFVEINRSI